MQRKTIHPLASAFPPMAEDDFAKLMESIKERGLQTKIVLLDDMILDGRNREEACFRLGIPPIFREYDPTVDGEHLVDFVTDANLHRRHLTAGQKAALAVELEPYFAEKLKKQKGEKLAKKHAKKRATKKAANDANQQSEAATAEAGEVEPPPTTDVQGANAPPAEESKPSFDSIPAPLEWADVEKIHGKHDAEWMFGARAAFEGKSEDACPYHEGTRLHGLWMDGFDAETARYGAGQAQAEAAAGGTGTGVEIIDGDGEKEEEEQTGQKASEAAAAATGAGASSVRKAKELKEKDPEAFKNVAAGNVSLNQASQEAKQKAAKSDPYRHECADMLEASHGEEISDAIRNSTILHEKRELETFMKLELADQKSVLPYLAKKWKLDAALAFMRGQFDGETMVKTLIAYANANKGTATVTIDGFTFAINREKQD